ncbi:MAG: type II toxin-antitoxin system RelE/ParE family toxin [Alphaproteobacteria bacterium]|jgi:toxin ParE1/3/4|nr:type II toxin-antitoxin system RelE/ParE family toxin [Alphaproteobacteria bacterium]
MAEVRLRPQARSDLKEIWRYSNKHWGLATADAYIQALDQAFGVISQNSEIGRSLGDIAPSYRKYVARSHFIVYRLVNSEIQVIRILHRRMDIESHILPF